MAPAPFCEAFWAWYLTTQALGWTVVVTAIPPEDDTGVPHLTGPPEQISTILDNIVNGTSGPMEVVVPPMVAKSHPKVRSLTCFRIPT